MAERHDADDEHPGEQREDDDLPLKRRNFLQLGLAGAAVDPAWLDASTDLDDWVTTDLDGPTPTNAPRTSPSPPRVSFPLVAPLVSVGGLAPPVGTALGDASRTPDGRFSITQLAGAYELDRNPTSVRELTTPQRSGPLATSATTRWENWLEDYALENAQDVTITGDEAAQRLRLIELVVQKTHEKFRAVGSGHSHSEAARPERFFSDMKTVEGTLSLPWLRPADDPFWTTSPVVRDHLVRLQAGTVLKRLNRRILQQIDLALPNMGSWDGQTLAGAINTSTHGTGLGLGTFPDLVRSVEIVSVPESQYETGEPHVTMYRIEPTDGITDPEAFARAAGTHNTLLVQDDDLFHAVVVGYGSLGIAYSYTLELQQPYWLRERNTIESWRSFDPVAVADSNRHFNFLVDLVGPQITNAATPTPDCLLRTRNPVPANGRTPTERSNASPVFEENITEFLNFHTFFTNPVEFANRLAEFTGDLGQLFTGNVLSLAGYDPPFLPGPGETRGRDDSVWYIALRRKREEDTDPDVDPEPPVDAITLEVAVPVEQVVPAVDRVIEYVQAHPRFFPAPLGVRFTDESEHFFSPEYDRRIAMLEFIIPQPEKLQENLDEVELGKVYFPTSFKKIFYQKLKRVNKQTDGILLDHFLDLSVAKAELEPLEAILVDEFDGRPHLGKFNTVHVDASNPNLRPQRMFPEYETWAAVESYLNAFETFDGAFTDNKTRT